MNQKILLLFFLFSTAFLSGCYYDNEEELYPTNTNTNSAACDTVSIKYTTQIAPIMTQKCNGCHDAANYASSGNSIQLDTYQTLKNAINNKGLVKTIEQTDPNNFTPMPLVGDKLEQASIDLINQWIANGMPNC